MCWCAQRVYSGSRLLTRNGLSAFPIAAAGTAESGRSPIYVPETGSSGRWPGTTMSVTETRRSGGCLNLEPRREPLSPIAERIERNDGHSGVYGEPPKNEAVAGRAPAPDVVY